MTITACVTGGSGFIGSHVVRELLERGYTVRATVRDAADAAKTAHLTRLAQGLPGALELHSADLSRPGSFDAAVAGCQHVHHMATAVYLNAADPQREIVDPAVQGTDNVLRAVDRAESVEALTVTSSIAAVIDVVPRPDHIYTEADWNRDATLKNSPYALAKTLAERAVWRWHDALPAARKIPLTVINPVVVFGPVHAKAHLRSSPDFIRSLLLHNWPGCPGISLPLVDVRDVAAAQVAGAEQRATGRFILFSESLWMRELAQILAPAFPDFEVNTLPLPGPLIYLAAVMDKRVTVDWVRNNLNTRNRYSGTKVISELGITPRPVRQSALDTAASAVEQGFVSTGKIKRRPLDPLLLQLERQLRAAGAPAAAGALAGLVVVDLPALGAEGSHLHPTDGHRAHRVVINEACPGGLGVGLQLIDHQVQRTPLVLRIVEEVDPPRELHRAEGVLTVAGVVAQIVEDLAPDRGAVAQDLDLLAPGAAVEVERPLGLVVAEVDGGQVGLTAAGHGQGHVLGLADHRQLLGGVVDALVGAALVVGLRHAYRPMAATSSRRRAL